MRYLGFRLLGFVGVLLCTSALTFALMHSIPGGPFDAADMPLPADVREAMRRSRGLDRPLPLQYLTYVGYALRGDLGMPYQSPGETVTQVIARAWPVTAHLTLMSLTVAVAGGLALGITAAYRSTGVWGTVAGAIGLAGMAAPPFVLAVLLLLTAGRWLPAGGWDGPSTWVLPVVAHALAPMGIVARYTSICVRDALGADHVRTGLAKGLGGLTLSVHHVLRNAAIPLLTVGGQVALALVTGSVFVESVFRVPGLGGSYVTSILKRDYPMIMGLTLLTTVVVSLTYLLTDVLYVAADPRVRLGEATRA